MPRPPLPCRLATRRIRSSRTARCSYGYGIIEERFSNVNHFYRKPDFLNLRYKFPNGSIASLEDHRNNRIIRASGCGASMASVHPLPDEKGNENAIFHSNSISGSISQQMMQTCHSPALVTPLATAFPPIETNAFIPNFTEQRHLASDKFMVDRDSNGTDVDADSSRKPDREHKKRSKNWTRAETLKLIKLRTELASKFARTGRKSELWDQIASGLQQEQYFRDAQQCRDKWEKLMAGYKEVKDGHKDSQDYPFYEELHPLLSGKAARREIDNNVPPQHESEMLETAATSRQLSPSDIMKTESENKGPSVRFIGQNDGDDDVTPDETSFQKRKRCPKHVMVHTDLRAIQAVLETVISCQQKIFKDFLETLERNEQQREQIREEREEKWRAEERAQKLIFYDAMLLLTQKLVEDKTSGHSAPIVGNTSSDQELIKRSKNWRRFEILELIKSRANMDSKFSIATRRAALWEEISGMLNAQGIKRDGKQCREKWEKLVAEFKDVRDGKKEPSDSPYFQELITAMGIKHPASGSDAL